MIIQDMFAENINRKINGVIKVDQDADDVIEQELNEYVITRELKKHFITFFNYYGDAFDQPTADMGVWISGFFGSGKSHFLKMLSYLLENKEVKGIRSVERFRKKFEDDPATFMLIDRATKGLTETILFNIDIEGFSNKDKTAVLKAEIFWHSASIEQKAKLDIKPCTNDISSAFCSENCISGIEVITMNDGNVRAKCLYRALRVGWIREIIELYNENDIRVKYWEKINSKKKKRLYLRYQEEELDYLVVFEKKSEKRVQLITAYPVFFLSAKKDYEKDYQNYIKETEKETK